MRISRTERALSTPVLNDGCPLHLVAVTQEGLALLPEG
jgi:hypothetical protein